MRSVASILVWSSASRVTVVPAALAAAQILVMFSRAVFSLVLGEVESDGGRLDRDLGRAAAGHAARVEPAEQPHVLVGDGAGLLRVDGVLAEVVQADQQAVIQLPPADGERVIGAIPGPRRVVRQRRHGSAGPW